jgi:hypothetical protein
LQGGVELQPVQGCGLGGLDGGESPRSRTESENWPRVETQASLSA